MKRISVSAVFFLVLMLVLMLAVAGCGKSPDEKRQAYMESAREYQEQGKYAEAAIQYQNALQIAPDDATALVSLGEAQLKLNRPQEAYASFSKASKADPKNVKAREYLASMLLLAKRYDMAEKEARAVLEIDPGHVLAREVLAQALFMGGKRDEGVGFMEGLLKGPHPTEEMYINTIQMYMAEGRTADALALIDKGSVLFPKSTRIRFMASDIYALQEDPGTALKWAQDAYKVSDGSVTAGVALAMFYARNNMDELYRNQLAAMKQKHPESPEPYLLEATILHTKKDLDGALKAARKARELKNSTQVRTLISQILLEKKEPEQAKELLTESMKEDARDVLSRVLLAQIYLDEKNAATALEVLGEPLKTAALSPDVASTAAQAYMLKGDVKKARELVENALREHDQNISLHRTMAKIHFLQGDFKKALTETELLVSHSVGTPDILYIGALSALRTSGPQAALPYIQSLKEKAADDWITLHAQLRYYLDLKDRKSAFPIAEKALGLYPDNEEALAFYASLAPGAVGLQPAIDKVKGVCAKSGAAGCHLVLSALLEGSGKKDLALAEIKKSIEMDPKKEAYYHALAQYYARNNMLKNALDEYEDILHKNPSDLTAATMLALLHQSAGNIDSARKTYQYILDRDPRNGLAANNMAWVLAEKGAKKDLDEALRLAQTAKDMYPEDPRVADTLGYVYLRKGMPDNALGQFQMASEKLVDEPTILYHKALALVELKRDTEAVNSLRKALGVSKGFPEKGQAEALLARLIAGEKK